MDDTNLAYANEQAERREKQSFYNIDNSYVTFNDADKRRALESTPTMFNGSVHQQKVDFVQSTSKSCLNSYTLSPAKSIRHHPQAEQHHQHRTTYGLHKRWAQMTINLLFLLNSLYKKDLHHPRLSRTAREGHVNGKWRTGYAGKMRRRDCELYITFCQLLTRAIIECYLATILHILREQKESKQ